jgi:hypothetical protein
MRETLASDYKEIVKSVMELLISQTHYLKLME